jgi:hypothetical protein
LRRTPGHGSRNGFFDAEGAPLWLDACPSETQCGISSHIRPFSHPDRSVVKRLAKRRVFRTDEHDHVTFTTNGSSVGVKYSH